MFGKNIDLQTAYRKKLQELMLPVKMVDDLDRVYLPLANIIHTGLNALGKTSLIGINGAQGAGKSTFNQLLKLVLETQYGLRVVGFSIDDFYLSLSERKKLSESVHPLFVTRGVPGTHDVQLCESVIDSLSSADAKTETVIPRFDKSTDNPFPKSQWDTFVGKPDVILFDGWCVGAVEQKETDLLKPVNDLEKEEDPYCVWRRYVNAQLKDIYRPLFEKIDLLVMLKVPSFEKVYEWRKLQEDKLRMKTAGRENLRVMSDDELHRFISHYERLTRFMLSEMPQRADMLFHISDDHSICI